MKIHSLILTFTILLNSCFAQEEELATKLQKDIYRINNQYFYSEKVNVYLFELEDRLLIFDIPTYTLELEKFIQSFKKPVNAILSHGSCGIEDGTLWQEKIGMKVYAHKADESHPWIRMKPDVLFTEIPEFADNIEVIHTPGHSKGAICVLEKNTKSLFTGDTFYGNKEGKIMDFTKENQSSYENLEDRLRSSKELLKYDFVNVYPFHHHAILNSGKSELRNFFKDK